MFMNASVYEKVVIKILAAQAESLRDVDAASQHNELQFWDLFLDNVWK
jgi:hypothetical protein